MPAHYEPYFGIIQQALESRGSKPDDWQQDKGFRQAGLHINVYVGSMCETLAAACRLRGAASVTALDVVRKDILASGHADYHRKLAMYCSELERQGLEALQAGAPAQSGSENP